MKQTIKGIIIGIMLTSIFFTSIQANSVMKNISVALNHINLNINDKKIATSGESYRLSNGNVVPYSILYKGTTYLPIRKASEILGKTVDWDIINNTANIIDKEDSKPTDSPIGSIDNPIPLGKRFVCEVTDDSIYGNYKVAITVNKALRGLEANKIVKSQPKLSDEELLYLELTLELLEIDNIGYQFDILNRYSYTYYNGKPLITSGIMLDNSIQNCSFKAVGKKNVKDAIIVHVDNNVMINYDQYWFKLTT